MRWCAPRCSRCLRRTRSDVVVLPNCAGAGCGCARRLRAVPRCSCRAVLRAVRHVPPCRRRRIHAAQRELRQRARGGASCDAGLQPHRLPRVPGRGVLQRGAGAPAPRAIRRGRGARRCGRAAPLHGIALTPRPARSTRRCATTSATRRCCSGAARRARRTSGACGARSRARRSRCAPPSRRARRLRPPPSASRPAQGSFVNVTAVGYYDDTSPPRGVAVADVAQFNVAPPFGDALCAPLPLAVCTPRALPR